MSGVRIFRGRRLIEAVEPGERGLAYGDGLFETMRVHRGEVAWWARHQARLAADAARLAIALPDPDFLGRQISQVAGELGEGVIKLILTRGAGARGYLPDPDAEPTLMLSRHALPAPPGRGLLVHPCELRLGSQPRLAGIKHLNRLEQVLARIEAHRAGADEGLLLDLRGLAVCATSANVMARIDGRWLTPPIIDCGVAGVCRGWLLEQGLVEQEAFGLGELFSADAVFLCNAVRGILTVERLGRHTFPRSQAVAEVMARLGAAHPAFATSRSPPSP